MVSGVRALMVLLLGQVLLEGSIGLIPEVGRRRYSESGRQSPPLSDDILNDFELRLLNMFGLKRRPNPSKAAVVPQYMVDLYHMHAGNGDHNPSLTRTTVGKLSERSASRANTIRSFHHEGKSLTDQYCSKSATLWVKHSGSNSSNDTHRLQWHTPAVPQEIVVSIDTL